MTFSYGAKISPEKVIYTDKKKKQQLEKQQAGYVQKKGQTVFFVISNSVMCEKETKPISKALSPGIDRPFRAKGQN